jgi:sulfonate transport system ATP-binding protein
MQQGVTIQLEGLCKNFGDVQVFKDVNLSIKPGEFVALVGKSGCGKSTLLRCLSSLDSPSSGAVKINGTTVEKINPDVRYLFQEARLLPWKSVRDNVALGAKNRSVETTEKSLQAVGLLDKAKEWPEVLSGGQRQRVSLARALAGNPRILLLDEPLGALDALTRIQMQVLIEELWEKQRFTVVLVTHDVSEAVYLADRIILLENGAIAMDEQITLSRPRVKDHDFVYFEKRILDHILHRAESTKINSVNGWSI